MSATRNAFRHLRAEHLAPFNRRCLHSGRPTRATETADILPKAALEFIGDSSHIKAPGRREQSNDGKSSEVEGKARTLKVTQVQQIAPLAFAYTKKQPSSFNKDKFPFWDGRDLIAIERENRAKVPPQWLRDNCQCSECIHPVTKQRQLDTFRQTKKVSIDKCQIEVETKEPHVRIEWQDGHQSIYPMHLFIERNERAKEGFRRGLKTTKFWDSSIARAPPRVDYAAVQESGVGGLLEQIRLYGFCLVENSPKTPEATQALLEQIGPIRNTHYGGFYDFTSDMASKDTAYTDLALEAHTDTTYFSDPAGLQAFHMLSHTGGTGGKSLLVDGFAAAKQLFDHHPKAYQVLSTFGVYYHASGNEDVSVQPYTSFPVLLHDPVRHNLVQIRWNNADRAGLDKEWGKTDMWYDAADKLNSIMNNPRHQYWFQLEPGTPLIFDNWRVLHGRSKFTGKRRMCGGYINRDDYISKYKLTNHTRENVIKSTVTG